MANFAISYIETIAQKRGRNVEWAKESVSKSSSITAAKALELKVIDLVASDRADLLKQLDGRVAGGRTLKTAGAEVVPIEMSLREKLFQTLWHPEVMFILMLVAIYGLIGELSNPGAILPGVVGAVALILALYMSSVLPVNFAGIALMVLAVVLFVAEVFTPTHGLLTIGGIIAFIFGALMLFDPAEPSLQLSWSVILPATILTAAFFLFIVGAGLRAQFLPAKTGTGTMIGQTVPALTGIGPGEGTVMIEGELWSARSDSPVAAGQPVEVTGVSGLVLQVKPKSQPADS
jgi:membrane-bound serine protease (ClpP class)